MVCNGRNCAKCVKCLRFEGGQWWSVVVSGAECSRAYCDMADSRSAEEDSSEDGACAGCMNRLLDEDYVSALGQEWHMECFRCSVCDAALSSWYFEKDGLLFCQADYWTRYGEACQQCGQIITGPVMAAGDHRFHPECFCCELCGSFIGDGEAYALVERSKLYCGTCYERVMRPLNRGGRRHAIRLVEVPPHISDNCVNGPDGAPFVRLSQDARRGLTIKQLLYAMQGKLAALVRTLFRATIAFCVRITKYSVDVSCGLMALHIGDRILEINGTPIKEQPIAQIEHLICYSDTVLQLTIEHDPDNLDKTKSIPNSINNNSLEVLDTEKVNSKAEEISLPKIINDSKPDEIVEERNDRIKDVNFTNYDIETKDRGSTSPTTNLATRERVFKKRGEENGGIGIRNRQLWRKIGLARTPHPSPLKTKERSSSMSRLIDGSCEHTESCENGGVFCDLARTRSFRVDARPPPTVFRAADLLQGELLGSGFFGQVFKVTHRDTNEVMVLKQLYRVDEDAQKNFLKEVAVLRSLSHPNVLRFVGVLYKERRLHLVTEYIGGGTLRALLEGPRAPPWAERAGYARDIAAGLAYLHRMNIIHRDLNSHNCLVKEDKTVIVADFGLARIVKRTGVSGSLERSQRGSARERKKRYTVVGNPYWMAPEMMKGNVYDEKVDVFSFGIVLCEIIGRVHADPDFLPRSPDFGLNQTLFVDKFCEGCPESLYNIAFICCNLNPDKRPPFEVIEVWLEALSMHLSVQRPPPSDLLQDILQYNGSPEVSSITPTSELTLVPPLIDNTNLKIEESHIEDNCSVLKKSKSGNVFESDSKIKTEFLSDSTRVKGLGPKCISTSHLCSSNKPVVPGIISSKSQNALSFTPAGYILSTENKKINITKVDDVREWLDNPIMLKNGKIAKEAIAEKRQSLDNSLSETEFNFQNKSRKVDTENDGNDSIYKVSNKKCSRMNYKESNPNITKVFKSQSSNHSNVDSNNATNLPSYLRNQSVEELESDRKMVVDVIQPISRHFSIPDQSVKDDLEFSSDSDDNFDDCKQKKSSPLTFKRIFKNDSNVYTVNPEESPKSKLIDNTKRKMNVSNSIQQLRQNFEPKQTELFTDKNKSFNTFAKKLLSPKLGRKSINNPLAKIFHTNHISDDDNSKVNKKGKSTFFISKPHNVEVNKNECVHPLSPQLDVKNQKMKLLKCKPPKVNIWPLNLESSDQDLISNTNKVHSIGKCVTPLLRRHNRQTDDIISSVGRFSYREKRSSPLKYTSNDKNLLPDLKTINLKQVSKNEIPKAECSTNVNLLSRQLQPETTAPLIRCNNFTNIPILNSIPHEENVQLTKKFQKESSSEAIKDTSPGNVSSNEQKCDDKLTDNNPLVKYNNSELGISSSNYVSLANLRINCPSLGRTRESLVKRNISKFDPNGRHHVKNKVNNEKCASNVESSCLSVKEYKKSLESTPL